MYTYDLLEPGCYYLLEQEKNEPIKLIQVKLVTDSAMYVVEYGDSIRTHWKKKNAPIHDILELLSDEDAMKWQKAYYDNEDAYHEEDDD